MFSKVWKFGSKNSKLANVKAGVLFCHLIFMYFAFHILYLSVLFQRFQSKRWQMSKSTFRVTPNSPPPNWIWQNRELRKEYCFCCCKLNLFIIHFPDLRWNAIGILGGDSLLELIQVINIFHQKGGWKKTTKTSICRQRGGNATNNNKNIQLQTNPSLSRVDLQGNHIPKDTLRAIGSHRTISLSIIASSWSSLSSW